MAEKKLSNIEIWNARVKNASWYKHIGKQGIHYEYLLPQGANEDRFYEEAIDVRSKKGNNRRRSSNGNLYRPGSYQPVGDKRYFNFYQMRKMGKKEWMQFYIDVEQRAQQKILLLIQKALAELM